MDRKKPIIVIDGDNVLRHESIKNGNKNDLKLLLKVIEELNQQGFDVIPLVSAKTRHYVENSKHFEDLVSKGSIIEIPAKTDNDLYILEIAKQLQAQVLSNDLFRGYSKTHPETVRRRLPFMILRDKLIIPEINRSIN